MSSSSQRAFSVLVGLDPLGVTGGDGATTFTDGVEEASTAESIARIIAQPRHASTAPSRAATVPLGARHRPRLRAGAVGLLASAAIAAITMLLWAPPSAGESADRTVSVVTQVSGAHGPLHSPPVGVGPT